MVRYCKVTALSVCVIQYTQSSAQHPAHREIRLSAYSNTAITHPATLRHQHNLISTPILTPHSHHHAHLHNHTYVPITSLIVHYSSYIISLLVVTPVCYQGPRHSFRASAKKKVDAWQSGRGCMHCLGISPYHHAIPMPHIHALPCTQCIQNPNQTKQTEKERKRVVVALSARALLIGCGTMSCSNSRGLDCRTIAPAKDGRVLDTRARTKPSISPSSAAGPVHTPWFYCAAISIKK